MKLDLSVAFANAIMTREPMVIVEGKDDWQIYTKLAKLIDVNVQVYQVNEFEDYAAGCFHVIACLDSLQPELAKKADNIHFILGVIDRDVRPFRNELPTHLKGLFVTKYYSIETYFATRQNLLELISNVTSMESSYIEDSILDFVEELFNQSLVDLYYISLEALKHACVPGYSAVVSYSDKGGEVFKEVIKYLLGDGKNYTLNQIEPKKTELDIFASGFGLGVKDLKYITKGKWYLYFFVYCGLQQFRQLSQKCKDAKICRSCKVGNHQDCLFKLKRKNLQPEELYERILNVIDLQECEDIIQAFHKLSRPSQISDNDGHGSGQT
jgi:hypothetical protein